MSRLDLCIVNWWNIIVTAVEKGKKFYCPHLWWIMANQCQRPLFSEFWAFYAFMYFISAATSWALPAQLLSAHGGIARHSLIIGPPFSTAPRGLPLRGLPLTSQYLQHDAQWSLKWRPAAFTSHPPTRRHPQHVTDTHAESTGDQKITWHERQRCLL